MKFASIQNSLEALMFDVEPQDSKVQRRTYGQFHTAHGNRLVVPEPIPQVSRSRLEWSEMGQSTKSLRSLRHLDLEAQGAAIVDKDLIVGNVAGWVLFRGGGLFAAACLPPVKPALAYRFDFKDRSIAFSGDIAPLEAVAKMAEGADVLVHETMYVPALETNIREQLLRVGR